MSSHCFVFVPLNSRLSDKKSSNIIPTKHARIKINNLYSKIITITKNSDVISHLDNINI